MGARGLLLIVSSPSGAGKTTLCRLLMADFPAIRFSVSVTTRAPRVGEVDGVDYRFVSATEFQAMIDRSEFAEWAEVHGHRYGTTLATVTLALEQGVDVLFDIDWQGGRQLKQQFPTDAVMVWVLPPSLHELALRLRRRATDDDAVIERRLEAAKLELQQYGNYRYLVVNDDLAVAYEKVRAIYVASHCEIERGSAEAEALVRQVRDGVRPVRE
ncbi:MAG: guanylate kinase [Myxococcales bacterium]|nr:guanylate kinase [Myxococcales bacterium]